MKFNRTTLSSHDIKDCLRQCRLYLLTTVLWAFNAGAHAAISNADDSAWIDIETSHTFADVFLTSDVYSSAFTLDIRNEDLGRQGELFLVAQYNGNYYMKVGQRWPVWDGRLSTLQPVRSTVLSSQETIQVLEDNRLNAGEYSVFAGYRVNGGSLVNEAEPLVFRVESSAQDSLQRFASEVAMETFIKQGLQAGAASPLYSIAMFSPVADSSVAAGAENAARVSSTNLQVSDVDEQDSIKTDGQVLYSLESCDGSACLGIYDLNPAAPSAQQLASYDLGGTVFPDGMFLVQDRPSGSDLLITVAGQNSWGYWYDMWGWSGNTTEVEFFDSSDPVNLSSIEKLSLDGSLVSSRRVGDTLYLVTRYTPAIEGFIPYAADTVTRDENAKLLAQTSLPELLPRVVDSSDEVRSLIESRDCYLPVSAVDESRNPSIITISSVPLSAPDQIESTCFLGASETLYMTSDSLYLATTRYEYDLLSLDALVYSPDHRTAIHKFALENDQIDYRGSAEVEGHLGWAEDKKSFRMGENGDYLNVVTSVGDTWNESSSTMLTVLTESGVTDELEEVNRIEGIGKPGEQLYAARFVGDRAYLVTFRITDPLYVVDLGNQQNPRIAGELEIDGYSDYLHPITDTLLLGIGKDAVPDNGQSAIRDPRGAWYQGVKLALFDVSDPSRPTEVDSRILGKRGTETAVSWDHHAFTFLAADNSSPARFTIPLRLHDTVPTWTSFDASDPSSWYDYTHTGLYAFEASEQGIDQVGRIIAENAVIPDILEPVSLDDNVIIDDEEGSDDPASVVEDVTPERLIYPYIRTYGDRSVLLDDAVFYIHDGEIRSSFWGENQLEP